MVDPIPAHAKPSTGSSKVEAKVWWATAGAYVAGVAALAVVNAFTGDDNALLLASLPDAIEPFVLPVVPTVVAFVTGWLARHTPRPDLEG